MTGERPFSVPDRVFFTISALVIVATVVFAILIAPQLPIDFAARFGWTSGVLHSRTAALLLIPIWQLIIAFAIAWAYRHPMYFHFPTRQTFTSFSPELQKTLTTLARHMLSVMCVLSMLILAQTMEIAITDSVGSDSLLGLSSLTFLLFFLALVGLAYAGFMRHIIRRSRLGTK